MLKLRRLFFIFVSSLLSQYAFANSLQAMDGIGLDNKPCTVRIIRDGKLLKSVQLKGAAEIFQILAERGSSYGPETVIDSWGAEEVFAITNHGNDHVYQYFTHSENMFSNGEVFKLNTDDIPKNSEKGLKGVKLLLELSLDYDGEELVNVTATSKAKALIFATLGSAKFKCTARQN